MDTVAVVQHKLVKTVKWVYLFYIIFYWAIKGTLYYLFEGKTIIKNIKKSI